VVRLAAVLTLLTVTAGCCPAPHGAAELLSGAPVPAVRPTGKLPCWCDPPLPPVEVARAESHRDGGTILVTFTDARGCEYEVCRDGRMWTAQQFDASVSRRSSSGARFLVSAHEWGCADPVCLHDVRAVWPEPQRCVYIGARHPEHDGAEVLDPDSALGMAIRNALDHWLVQHVTACQRARIDSVRAGAPIHLTEEERRERRVERVSRSLHERVCARRASN